MSLWNYLRDKMMLNPEQLLCEGDRSFTYREICEIVERKSKELEHSSYGILCDSELNAAVVLLTCLAANKTAVLLPTRYGPEVYEKILKKSKVPAIIKDREIIGNKFFCEEDSSISSLLNTAVILFTSGSTGEPKGIMLSDENLISNVEDISSYFEIDCDDTILISRPLYHSSVLTGEFFVSICKGCKIVFLSVPFNPFAIFSTIKKYLVTVMGSTPTLMSTLARFVRENSVPTIKKLSISGECMTEGMANKIRKAFPKADIYCGYGLSEASPRVAFLPPTLFDKYPTAAGFPLNSISVKIINDNNKQIFTGGVGELIVKGPNVMQGYFNDPNKTKKVLEKGYLHTGDLAFYGEDKLLYIKGRKDDMIICAGMNIYPAEIENELSVDGRIESVVASGYIENGMQKIALKVIGDFLNTDEVAKLCKEKLPKYQMPSKIILLDKEDILCGGKKRRKNDGIRT